MVNATGTIEILLIIAPEYTIVNRGLIEGTGVAGFSLYSLIDNSGGTIFAGNGSNILCNTRIIGGTLSTAGTGVILTGKGLPQLDGRTSAVTTSGHIDIRGQCLLGLVGSIINSGTITIESSDAESQLYGYAKGATLSGGGTIELLGPFSVIDTFPAKSSTRLTNLDNTIVGAGSIGLGRMTLVEGAAAVIDATGKIVLDTAGEVLTNHGLMEATGTGTLSIVSTTVDQAADGVIQATAGARVVLTNDRVEGGFLRTSGTGVIQTAGDRTMLDGRTSVVTSTATIAILNQARLTLEGSIVNSGSMALKNGAGTLAVFQATVDQSGGGSMLAGTGTRIRLEGADIVGGAIGSTGTGAVIAAKARGASTLDGSATAVAVSGRLNVSDGATLTLVGSIANSGTLSVGAAGTTASLMIGAGGASLSGGGALTLRASAGNGVGSASGVTLTNVDERITGGGNLGGGQISLVNEAGGIIAGNIATALVIDTGANTIVNAGVIAATGAGGVTVKSALDNTGTIKAVGGVLTLGAAVTGSGQARINGGVLDFASSFEGNVSFAGPTGVLELAQSQTYIGKVTGLSTAGTSSLDLVDIAFTTGTTTASFSGTAKHTGGVLTVTDGTHTAHFRLIGDYSASTFKVASDGHGGTTVTDPAASAASARFIAATSALGSRPTSAALQHPWDHSPRFVALAGPRVP